MNVTITELDAPAALDGAGGKDFIAYVQVRNVVESHALGTA